MSDNHHTPIAAAAARNAATINAPLGELDQAITDNATAIAVNSAALSVLDPSFLMRGTFQARLSASASDAVTTSDSTSATLRLYPFRGSVIGLFDPGNLRWYPQQLSSAISLSLSGFAVNANHDVFVSETGGSPVLSAAEWQSDLARSVALARQDGVYVNANDQRQRYCGTIRVHSDGNVHDTLLRRFLWNYYNRARRQMLVTEAAANWTYNVANTWRAVNNNANNRVEFVLGVQEDAIEVQVQGSALIGTGSATFVAQSAGLDTTTGVSLTTYGSRLWATNTATALYSAGALSPAAGYHFLSWNEAQDGTSTITYQGVTSPIIQQGLAAEMWA